MANNAQRRRGAILEFVDGYQCLHGYSPTLREIGGATGISSTYVVHYHLIGLEERGLITRKPGAARSVVVTGRGRSCLLAGGRVP